MSTRLVFNRKSMASAIAVALGCAFVTATQAAVIIPTKGGFSGHVNLGVGGVAVESNMLSSILSGKVNVGNKELITCPTRPTTARVGQFSTGLALHLRQYPHPTAHR
ncbi:MAG: hypothetical protein H6987_16565 [Pseudomonadales bacterium]|nr:hypothetical protein [Pseudomonadales bacterium]